MKLQNIYFLIAGGCLVFSLVAWHAINSRLYYSDNLQIMSIMLHVFEAGAGLFLLLGLVVFSVDRIIKQYINR